MNHLNTLIITSMQFPYFVVKHIPQTAQCLHTCLSLREELASPAAQTENAQLPTNAIANAGLRVRWNIWNLYIHLCWQTVEQQFIPALAIASAVVNAALETLTKGQNSEDLTGSKIQFRSLKSKLFSVYDNLDEIRRSIRERQHCSPKQTQTSEETCSFWIRFQREVRVGQTFEITPRYNKQYNKCGFRVNVETFGIFKYICAGLKVQCNLVPHLSYCRPLPAMLK